jgi:DME family drug/metabolite transporter
MFSNISFRFTARHGIMLILMSALMWGTVGVATKGIYTLSDTNALSIGFFRLMFASPALLLTCWLLLGKRMFQISLRDLGLMALMGVMMALYQVCYFASIAYVGVSIAVLVTLCTAPVMVALLAAFFLKERLGGMVLLALVCAIAGTTMLVWVEPGTASQNSNTLMGVLLALGSALGYAVLTLVSRSLSGHYHPIQPISIGFSAGALMLLPFALANGLVSTYPGEAWLLLVYMGLVPTALAYILFLTGIRYTTATVASILTLIEPLTSTLLAWYLFGEQFSQYGWFGALLLLSAIGLLYKGSDQPAPQPEPEPANA